MPSLLFWYLLVAFVGWLTFPLTYHLFPALTDRGYTLARAFGLLIWGYVFWLFASLGIAQNDIGGLLLGLIVLGGLSARAFVKHHSEIVNWLHENRRFTRTANLIFFIAFVLMAFFRSANPEILGTEKPMELMFISGIMNSPTFPPRDLWLSGYSISYYYFGYVMTSMLAMFTGTPATAAFNLMISMIFALSAIGAYGILYNLLAIRQKSSGESPSPNNNPLSSLLFPLFAPLFLLLISNVEGFLEVLHRKGFFWQFNADGTATSRFWTWLNIKELSDAPAQPLVWVPERFWWWWRASRVLQDYDLTNTWHETIDEFPAFSYILGDLHPHVLSMPFILLAVAVALNLFLGGWRGNMELFFGQLRISKAGFLVIALTLGGLAFLNTWDILIGMALIVFSYALAQVHESGWDWERAADVLLLGIPAAVVALLMYLPFYVGFDSQAGGIVPNFVFMTRGTHLWVMWGTLFVPLFAYLIYLWRSETPAHWRAGIFTMLGILIALFVAMFVIGLIALKVKPDLVESVLQSQGRDAAALIADGMVRRLQYIGSLLTLLAILIPTLSFLIASPKTLPVRRREAPTADGAPRPMPFVLLLIALSALLILAPDFLYLRDNFGYRINTVFKFYYQAWIVMSLAAAYGAVVLLRNLRGAANIAFSVLFALVLIVGLTYPVLGVFNKANSFKAPFGYTLDDFDRVQRENPDEAAAILWLRSAPDGVVAEAVGDAYSNYARISIYTGLPTVIGWENHEGQWRDRALQGSRRQDIERLYTAPDWLTAQEIIARYQIRYIYVGNLERTTYPVNEEKFNHILRPVFQQGNVTIYETPQD